MVALLVDMGADINGRDESGRAPLHYAVQSDHISIVEFLLQHGAQVDQLSFEGETPPYLAILVTGLKLQNYCLNMAN
jgi:ankyrin repeat protein